MADLDAGAVEGAAHHDALQRAHADLLVVPDAEGVDEEVFELVEAVVLAPGLAEEDEAWRRVCRRLYATRSVRFYALRMELEEIQDLAVVEAAQYKVVASPFRARSKTEHSCAVLLADSLKEFRAL